RARPSPPCPCAAATRRGATASAPVRPGWRDRRRCRPAPRPQGWSPARTRGPRARGGAGSRGTPRWLAVGRRRGAGRWPGGERERLAGEDREVAGGAVLGRVARLHLERRLFDRAARLGLWAARVEAAARGRTDRGRDVAREDYP